MNEALLELQKPFLIMGLFLLTFFLIGSNTLSMLELGVHSVFFYSVLTLENIVVWTLVLVRI